MRKSAFAIVLFAGFVCGQTHPPPDLTDASLEQLMDIQVTSASKKGERLAKTAASVYVVSSEDIRRSGFHTLPEVLRLVPGVQVARTSAGAWAISIRGFNDEFANKLLVLIDGRQVYNELFSGVFWDAQNVPLDNIDRIEVIRGPVAALWGTNAVNGVINIITKGSEATQGGLVSMESGTAGELNARARFGGAIGSKATYRFGVGESRTSQFHAPGGLAPTNGWASQSVDFRLDWNPTPADSVFVTGQAYQSNVGHQFLTPDLRNPLAPPTDAQDRTSAGNLMLRWERSISERSSVEGKLSWEHNNFGDPLLPLSYDIVEFGIKAHVSLGARHDLITGVDTREALYDITSTPTFGVHPGHIAAFTGSAFVEDEFALVPDKLAIIAGVHAGHNEFTGLEIQPTARLLWTPNDKSSTWFAISRAVRTPAIYHRGFDAVIMPLQIQPGVFAFLHTFGDSNESSETVIAYEVGQRLQPSRRFSVDLSAFYNNYGNLESITMGYPTYVLPTASLPGYLSLPSVLDNGAHGRTWGGDLSLTWNVNSRWKLSGGYSELHLKTWPNAGLTAQALPLSNVNPRHQFQAHSALDLTRKWQIDAGMYYTSNVESMQLNQAVPIRGHTRGDLRVGWRPTERIDVSAGIQDAFNPLHLEFISSRFYQQLEVRRNIYGSVRWQF